MNKTLDRQKKLVEICSMIAVVLLALIFVVLSVAAILQTSRIDPQKPASENILFENDAIPVNIALIVISALAFISLMRRNIHISKVDTRFILFVMLIVTTLIPLVWINLTQSMAAGDAKFLLNTAREAAQDSYNNFTGSSSSYYGGFSYYQFYPTQLGYVFFAEIFYRIFGTGMSDIFLQIPNVIALDFVYVGIVMLTKRLFDRPAVTNMTAIALTVCLQPMFMTTYTTGLFIGLALAVWSVCFTVKYMQENHLKHAGIAVLLIAPAVVIKFSMIVPMIAICIALILHAVGAKRLLALAAAALMIVCSIGGQKLMTLSYSLRSDTKLNTEVSQVLYAYMGISESTMASGWFNWNAMTTLRDTASYSADHTLDPSAADKAAWEGIGKRIKYLSENHLLGEFYKQKFLSQFNEPSFESVWISQTRQHDIKEGEQLSKLVNSVYTGGLSKLLDNWFNYYTMMVYIGFAAGMILMIVRRRLQPQMIILPVTVLGGMLYHMICEAKSQFFLPYFILLIPFAMYGLLETTALLKQKTDLLFKKQDEDTVNPVGA